jgi:hypothetical protein
LLDDYGGALAERIVEKGLASDAVVINTVVAKYCDHLPLYRQAVMMEREAGVEVGRATLDGWVMRVGELLGPLVGAMRRDLLAASYIQADETPIPVQMHDRRGENHQAYLWQYGKPGGETVFDFCLGCGREGPRKFLGPFSQMRKNIATRKVFPHDDAVIKILFLNIRNFSNRWSRRQGWDIVMNQLAVIFGDRLKSEVIDGL